MIQIRNTIGIWLFLALALLPFPYTFIPSIGEKSAFIWLHLTRPIAKLIGIENVSLHAHSDSIHSWILTVLLLPTAWIIAFLIKKFNKTAKVRVMSKLVLRFCLVLFLVKYGIDKLLLNQFSTAEPNILHSEVGNLSKDLLFWTSSGSSALFNYILGASQVFVALLLLFSRTRFIGLLLSIVTFSYIVLINFSFDISVKLFSTLLFFTSAYLISSYHSRIKLLFGSTIPQVKNDTDLPSPRYFSFILLTIIMLETILSTANIIRSGAQQNKMVGTYEVDQTISGEYFSRFFLRSDGHIVIEKEGQTTHYPIVIDEDEIVMIDKSQAKFRIFRKNEILYISWKSDDGMRSKEAKRLPSSNKIMKDEFHLFIENYQ